MFAVVICYTFTKEMVNIFNITKTESRQHWKKWRVKAMALYKVKYQGYYLIEADSIDEALETCRADFEVEFEEWENIDAEMVEE